MFLFLNSKGQTFYCINGHVVHQLKTNTELIHQTWKNKYWFQFGDLIHQSRHKLPIIASSYMTQSRAECFWEFFGTKGLYKITQGWALVDLPDAKIVIPSKTCIGSPLAPQFFPPVRMEDHYPSSIIQSKGS